ncbi:ABC transporter substrate-binding protein [Ornithinibacillus sp. 4-3]|uniref:ABC transporter substrate-binding protein n=1 Tax=Ornithinibacillus sp. 4-3 TaxID=3231488 RepID=A0AB39HKP5_9BACI
MKKNKFLVLLLMIVASMVLIIGCSNDSNDNEGSDDATGNDDTTENDNGEQTKGGTLKIAIDAAPPTLDQPTSTATAARDATRLIFESLVTTNSKFEPVPMLAESIDTEDNKTYTIKLREGVKFHNGKEMKAEDVIASMERWLEQSSITGNIFVDATWTEEDEYTVILELVEPSTLTLDTMASAKQAAGIMPKEVIESASADGIQEYIGTGPFELVEWRQDQYLHYKRYEDYLPREEEPDGLAGKKEALVDEIYFYLVPDTSTRIAGLQTGEYDFAYSIPYDQYDQMESNPDIETMLTPNANEMLVFNKVQGISTDYKIREAINVGLNYDETMMAAFPNKDFYWLDSGYMDVNILNWASTAGSEYYNQNDPEKAKELLEEAGYNGEEFKIMTTRDYDHHYNVGVVIHEQLKNLGINATLEIYDWPTMNDKMGNDFEAWDAFITSSSTVSTPPQLIALSPSFGGGVNDDSVGEAIKEIETAPTLEEAQQRWDELQLYAWEELLPIINIGGYNSFWAYNKKVEGIDALTGPIFWNVSIEE